MTITSQDLPAILEAHRKWTRGEPGGYRANLSGANLSGADLSGADLSGADLSGANLSRANLSRANLSGANLSGANLSGADLYGANLSRANLSRADLSGANLSRANLSGANLSGSNLSRADLYGANLSGADLYGAKWREGIVIERKPLFVNGLNYRVTILDNHMQIGCQFHSLEEWESFDNRAIAEMDGKMALKFWGAFRDVLLGMAKADGRGPQ